MADSIGQREPGWAAWFLVTVIVLLGTFAWALSGPGAAAMVEVTNETVSVDADTDTAYAELNNTNSTATANVTVTFHGVENASGNASETQISTHSVQVSNSSTQVVESSSVNGTLYDEVRVVAEVDNATVPSGDLTVTTGTFQKVSGGSGAGGLGGTSAVGVGVVVLAVVAALFMGNRDG